ncbi:phytoene/squalene synthase family protein [Skermanella pratensis]|uniref:phytoene/squalene synthase family protein n=1 Tax=Skermanella pratensis TaxID=2233999 RepID=UPI001FEBC454|nr:phytoene/squalene synthase family protein [Skermanella pratensis]
MNASRTFHAASLLLPSRVRQPASALYAFCRLADDAADLADDGDAALERMRRRLDRAYAGRPLDHAVDRAFADVVDRFAIPRTLPEALFEGFEWDLAGRRYARLGELNAYAARVAGTVGAMMAVLMGVRDGDVVARACDLGMAMQLSNIARDVGEDARAGRLYLPMEWLGEAGIDPDAWLADPVFSPALGGVVRRLLAAADEFYRHADSGIARLPPACRPGIQAARHLYAEIGREVERADGDSVSRRAVVPARRKALLLARASAAALSGAAQAAVPRSAEASRFLVEAVAATTGRDGSQDGVRDDPVVWLLLLFERLERGQRVALKRQG